MSAIYQENQFDFELDRDNIWDRIKIVWFYLSYKIFWRKYLKRHLRFYEKEAIFRDFQAWNT